MADVETRSEATYMVRIPVELTDQLTAFLRAQGVDFRPRDMAIRLNDGGYDPEVLQGHEAQSLLGSINRFLRERKQHPLVPGDPASWTHVQLHEFLELAMDHFEWGGTDEPTGAWWLEQGAPWKDVTATFRKLFGEVER